MASSSAGNVLQGGELARLFPVLADSSKEGRALSVLLACMANVDELGKTLLSTIGQRLGVRSRVTTYTEVVLKETSETASGRPDGMIAVSTGSGNVWRALVEAKVRRSRLEADQVDSYLRLAKLNGIDAVVTISNDFAAVPHHHPLRITRMPKGVALFHWSWTSILTHSKMLLSSDGVEDFDQRFLLTELVRFLDHPSTGVMRFDRMGGGWKDMVTSVVAGANLHKTSDVVVDSVANWHQECRDLALKLAEEIGTNVTIRLPRAHRTDPQRRIGDEVDRLCQSSRLQVELDVPDAAAPIKIEAALTTRSIQVSISLRAPGDRKSARARTNWLLRQLARSDARDLHLKALWGGRHKPTQAPLALVRENPDVLEARKGMAPQTFEVRLVRDAGARFVGAKTFVDELESSVLQFYSEAGQRLKRWQPNAPKYCSPEVW